MIWYFKKLTEDNNIAVYSYTTVKDDTEPGKISYDKSTEKITVVQKAINDKLGIEWAESSFWNVINEKFPDKRVVAIG